MSRPLRSAVWFALLFAAIGPGLSVLLGWLLATFLVGRLDGSAPAFDLRAALAGLGDTVMVAYAWGAIPAVASGALAGLISGLTVRALPAYAAAVCAGLLAPVGTLWLMRLPLQLALVFAPGAILAAVACVWLARRVGGEGRR